MSSQPPSTNTGKKLNTEDTERRARSSQRRETNAEAQGPQRKPEGHDSQEIIQRGFALWPRLPSRVDPHPLLRMLPNDCLDHLCELLRIHENILVAATGAPQCYRWLKP